MGHEPFQPIPWNKDNQHYESQNSNTQTLHFTYKSLVRTVLRTLQMPHQSATMSESLLPQKRTVDGDIREKGRTQTATPTPAPKPHTVHQKPTSTKLTINKFQPYISYKPSDFVSFQPAITESANIPGFLQIDDIPLNTRRGFQYSPCSPNPLLPVLRFGTTDLAPYKPSLSYFDRSNETVLSKDMLSLSTERGWVSSRVDVPITEGKVYWEFNVIESDDDGHVRLGVGRREASIEAPVGFDGYGYGLRDKTGQCLHLSRLKSFMEGGFKKGDVIGMVLELPKVEKKEVHEDNEGDSANVDELGVRSGEFQDIVRDQIAIRYKHRLFWEKFDYVSTPKMEHLLNPVIVFGERAIPDSNPWKPEVLPGSKLSIYKNGEFIGVAFEDLYDFNPPHSELKTNSKKKEDAYKNNGTLGYYPMLSVFKKGVAEINSGPDFKYKPLNLDPDVVDLIEIYNQRIADDTTWDIIDEIEAEFFQATVI